MLFLKVVIEGLVDRKSWGDIAVDDIKVLNGLRTIDCKGEGLSVHLHNVFRNVWPDSSVGYN